VVLRKRAKQKRVGRAATGVAIGGSVGGRGTGPARSWDDFIDDFDLGDYDYIEYGLKRGLRE